MQSVNSAGEPLVTDEWCDQHFDLHSGGPWEWYVDQDHKVKIVYTEATDVWSVKKNKKTVAVWLDKQPTINEMMAVISRR